MPSYHYSELEKKRRLPPARACFGGRTRIRLDAPHAQAIKKKNVQHILKSLEHLMAAASNGGIFITLSDF